MSQDIHQPGGIRVQKVLAQAGFGSRRACEQLILQGRVRVNGQKVVLGSRIDPEVADIRVDNKPVLLDDSRITIALHKPSGVVSAMSDNTGKPTLDQWGTVEGKRLFHVGRLDVDTEGLILLTNDGELANNLTHPSMQVQKTYLATVEGRMRQSLASDLSRKPVELEDGPVKIDSFMIKEIGQEATLIEIVIHEGRNRIVRRIMDEVGHPVIRLVRTQIGPVRIGRLKPGQTRRISGRALEDLMHAAGM